MTTTRDLNDTAKVIVGHLRDNGFLNDNGEGQILNLAEEAGEFVGAYRRWTGRARRTGTEQEAQAELAEETAVTAPVVLHQVGIYDNPDRDPRWRVVSVAYMAVLPELVTPTAGDDAHDAAWTRVRSLTGPDGLCLAFDHNEVLADAMARAFNRGTER